MDEVTFRGQVCRVERVRYQNGRVALRLKGLQYGELVAVATANMPDEPLAEDEVVIKDYSENEGMLRALVDAGIVLEPERDVLTGWVRSPVCRLAAAQGPRSQGPTDE